MKKTSTPKNQAPQSAGETVTITITPEERLVLAFTPGKTIEEEIKCVITNSMRALVWSMQDRGFDTKSEAMQKLEICRMLAPETTWDLCSWVHKSKRVYCPRRADDKGWTKTGSMYRTESEDVNESEAMAA